MTRRPRRPRPRPRQSRQTATRPLRPRPRHPSHRARLRAALCERGYNRDVSKHDPLTTNWYDPAFFAIYEAILSNDPSGATVPQFASGFSVSDDGLTYTFDIPEGKLSHSGGTVDAEMVAEFYRSVQAFSFIAGLAAPVDTYEADGNTVIMKMKNAWLGALGPHKTGYWRILNITRGRTAASTPTARSTRSRHTAPSSPTAPARSPTRNGCRAATCW